MVKQYGHRPTMFDHGVVNHIWLTVDDHMVEPYQENHGSTIFGGMVQPHGKPRLTMVNLNHG